MPLIDHRIPEDLIQTYSEKNGLDFKLVTAIVHHESGGIYWRTRYEPHTEKYVIYYREYASKLGISSETEKRAQMFSYGLGQIMGFLAREYQYSDYLPKLCLPEENIPLVCHHLKKLSERYESESAVISAYNQGSPRKTPGGMYENQRYVDSVYFILKKLRELG